jgi:putative oxidoreductase
MFIERISRLYAWLVRAASHCQSVVLLLIRLYWGYQFCITGWGKLNNLQGTADFFSGLGIPFPTFNAALAGGTECFGGALLLIGLASRLVALPLIFTMIVAYATDGREVLLGIFQDSDAFVTATPFLFLLASVIILVFGPGKISLDYLIERKRMQNAAASAELSGTGSLHGASPAG